MHETNKEIRALTKEELDRPETRRKVEGQSAAEQANGRKLSGLVMSGEDLVRQAMRNPQIGVGHLETWAQMLGILKDISSNRMPSVSDLLKQASQAPSLASAPKGNNAPMAGQIRGSTSSKPSESKPDDKKKTTAVPQVVDRESSQSGAEKPSNKPPSKSKGSSPKLGLAMTTLSGKSKPGTPPPPPSADEALDEAVVEQRDLLAEFDKIADELNRVLGNLEGSTLVKRLKSASRSQYKVAGRMNDQVGDSFGLKPVVVTGAAQKVFVEMAAQEAKGSQDVSLIMDDIQAYFERRRFMQFKSVLDEMKKMDVVGSLRQLGDDLKAENGVSIAQCEFWSDTLDRWADDLVDPACNGTCPGSKSKASLPPSVVLEVLQILEG
ncbi:hypothetical protein ACYOEI_25020, partial [Singulisphaera rosea]